MLFVVSVLYMADVICNVVIKQVNVPQPGSQGSGRNVCGNSHVSVCIGFKYGVL